MNRTKNKLVELTPGSSSSTSGEGKVAVADDVLPLPLLSHLQDIFKADSAFWSDHGYPTPGFFSYNVPMSNPKGQSLPSYQSLFIIYIELEILAPQLIDKNTVSVLVWMPVLLAFCDQIQLSAWVSSSAV